jgi:hypothetical protein
MKVLLTAWHDSATCRWCEKTRPCVTTTFADGFLQEAPLCWKCLETSVRVRQRKDEPADKSATERK